MFDMESLIPDITEDDIDWVCGLMGIDHFDEARREFLKCRTTVDLSACPGSGKTTLIVAKLAILAKKWPYKTKGICVLSHTNVAREQIEHRLGKTVVGQRLLSYPHFIDTIHGFANRFLAAPWLHSNGYPAPTIDNDVTIAYRRGVLKSKEYWTVQNFLKKNNKKWDFNQIRICTRDLSFDLDGRQFPAGPSSYSYQYTKRSIEAAAKVGYFCYDEMFVWADALLQDCVHLPSWLVHRFPLVIIDEMQDTFERQATFLNTIFPRSLNRNVVQRVGDPNQEIFDSSKEMASEVDIFPDAERRISIQNSYRFGKQIADFASSFAVEPVGKDGLQGLGPSGCFASVQNEGHAVFIFPDENTAGVLDAYGRHALSVLGPELSGQGLVTAVGHIHHDDPEVSPGHRQYPKSVGHYWDGYAAEISRKDPNPRTLAQYVQVAQGLTADGNVMSPGVEKIAGGILRLARQIGELGDVKRRGRTHRAIVEALGQEPEMLSEYRDIARQLLVDRLTLSADIWPFLSQRMTTVAAALCNGETDVDKAGRFLEWPEDDPSLQISTGALTATSAPNTYRVHGGDGAIDIRLGSIHSVKGQTHLATLLLHTFWNNHSTKRMMPWLSGQKTNGKGVGVQDKQRLLHTYVAMTRPSHLLCIAVPNSSLGGDEAAKEKTIEALKEYGWRVAKIVEGGVRWFN